MTRRTIIVIEDVPERVAWLCERVPDDVDVVHVESVEAFKYALDAHSNPALLIFDHDLSWDADGTGADAAKLVPDACPAPMLIWSGSPPGARRIQHILQNDKQCPNVLVIPFFALQPAVITALLEGPHA